MSKIIEISHDRLRILYRGKKYTINLTEELSISENLINKQLKSQPSNYAFLCLLRDDAIYKRDDLERQMKKAYSEAWLYYKENTNCNNDTAEHQAQTNKKYQRLMVSYLKAAKHTAKLISACRSYEARERILQSLNANLRKQQ